MMIEDNFFDNFSVRVRNLMRNMNINSPEELAALEPREILENKNIGVKTLREIRYVLEEMGYRMKDDGSHENPRVQSARRTRARVKKIEARIKLMLMYRFIDKLTYREIGERFGISGNRARQILYPEERRFKRHKQQATENKKLKGETT